MKGINYLHSLHPIQARDSLYTLLLFATQPIEFIDRMEWRPATELEKVASWKFWFEVSLPATATNNNNNDNRNG